MNLLEIILALRVLGDCFPLITKWARSFLLWANIEGLSNMVCLFVQVLAVFRYAIARLFVQLKQQKKKEIMTTCNQCICLSLMTRAEGGVIKV